MLLQSKDRLLLFLRGEMGIDVHGHCRIGVAEEVLGCLHIHPGVIKHGSVGVPKLMGGEPVHSNDLRMTPACIPSACLNVQVVHIRVPRSCPRRVGHHTAISCRTNIDGLVLLCFSEDRQKLGFRTHSAVLKRIRKIGKAYERYMGEDLGFSEPRIVEKEALL